jgi:hypothetical protein
MTSTAVQSVSSEDIKQAILALIKENNAEFKQFLGDVLPKSKPVAPKKPVKKQVVQEEPFVNKVHIPYSEMPFWKANPHLKPRVLEGEGGLSKEFLDALKAAQESFADVSDEEWRDILEQLKD